MAKNSNYHRADVALLRAENEVLKEKSSLLEEKNALLESQLSQQSAQIEELKRKLEHMNEVFANAQRAQYGQKSEKQQYVLGEDQISLFNEAEASQDHKAAEPTEQTLVAAHVSLKFIFRTSVSTKLLPVYIQFACSRKWTWIKKLSILRL